MVFLIIRLLLHLYPSAESLCQETATKCVLVCVGRYTRTTLTCTVSGMLPACHLSQLFPNPTSSAHTYHGRKRNNQFIYSYTIWAQVLSRSKTSSFFRQAWSFRETMFDHWIKLIKLEVLYKVLRSQLFFLEQTRALPPQVFFMYLSTPTVSVKKNSHATVPLNC